MSSAALKQSALSDRCCAFCPLAESNRSMLLQITKENDVLVLTDDNFDEAINEHSGLLVEFYAPWCGHCKNLQPAYDAAAKELAGKGLPLAKIDADAHKAAAGKYGVRGFPTIKYFASGKPVDYSGGRSQEDIVNYVVKKSGPAAAPLADAGAIKEFQGKSEAVIVGFFSKADSAGAKAFNEVSSRNLLHTYCIALCSPASIHLV
jgi:protein disulfide-isomerase A1